MSKRISSLLCFCVVFVPYVLLVVTTAFCYPPSSESFSGLPGILLWVPAIISSILPITYGILVIGFWEHLKRMYGLLVGFLMAIALLGLAGVVYLISH
ncbi:MAG: hypothetical protein ACLFVK_04555 [Dehalococcoidia bacterium]